MTPSPKYTLRLPRRTATLCLGVIAAAAVVSAWAGPARPPTKVPDKFIPLALDQVKLGGEFGRRVQVTVENSMLNLDIENDFLKGPREKKTKKGGNGLGLFLDSVVRLAAHTGDPRVVELKRHMIKTIIDAQEPDGYLGDFDRENRIWAFIDIQELAYLIQALVMDYRLFKEERSLAAAQKQADHILRHWGEQPAKWAEELGMTFHMTATGIERSMYQLYEHTGDRKYRDFCVKEMSVTSWNFPIVLGRHRPLAGHVYAYLSRCLAQLEWYRQEQPDKSLLASTRRAVDFMLHGEGMVVTGGVGDHECWHNTQTGTVNLTETCAMLYVLKVFDNLLKLEGDSLYGDLMERAIYNQLFSAQSPEGRKLRYYTAFDGPRSYWPRDTFCCPNSYRRSIGHLPEWIYYRTGNGVVVNLYSASSAKLELPRGGKVSIAQEADYPNSGNVTLRIDPDAASEFSVALRIPRWCANAEIHVNGQPVREAVKSGTYHTLRRRWQPGDRIELRMPMSFRFIKGRQAQAGKVAILRGPVVFGLDPSRDKQFQGMLLGTITLDLPTLEGALADTTVRPDGMACTIRGWKPGAWYPRWKPSLQLHLTELPDPKVQAIYFHVPNPTSPELSDDELLGQPRTDEETAGVP